MNYNPFLELNDLFENLSKTTSTLKKIDICKYKGGCLNLIVLRLEPTIPITPAIAGVIGLCYNICELAALDSTQIDRSGWK